MGQGLPGPGAGPDALTAGPRPGNPAVDLPEAGGRPVGVVLARPGERRRAQARAQTGVGRERDEGVGERLRVSDGHGERPHSVSLGDMPHGGAGRRDTKGGGFYEGDRAGLVKGRHHEQVRAGEERPDLVGRKPAVKRHRVEEAEACGELLNLAREGVLAEDVEEESRDAAPGEGEGVKERRLVLDAVEASDVEEPESRLSAVPGNRARLRREAVRLDPERDEGALDPRGGGRAEDRLARARDGGGAPERETDLHLSLATREQP